MNTSADRPAATSETPASLVPVAERILNADELLAGARVVLIDYRGTLYRLSLTHNDRLVLQK
jgi:hemin uptake protein HemP